MIDVDDGRNFDLIGEIEVTMGKIMGASKQTWSGTLKNKDKDCGKITIRSMALEAADANIPAAQPV